MICLKEEYNPSYCKMKEACFENSYSKENDAQWMMVEYEGECLAAVSARDYSRCIPAFLTLYGALDMTENSIRKGNIEDSYLGDIIKIPNGRVVVFENWANFSITEQLYQKMIKEIDEKELSYSGVIKFMLDNCE